MKRSLAGCLAAAMVALLGACGDEGAQPMTDAPSRVVGVITEIEPEHADAPESFVIEEEDGDTFTIEVDPEMDYGFDLHHVYEHFEEEDPLDVQVEQRDGSLVATSISDV